MSAAPAPSAADRIPRWDTRPTYPAPAAARGERDFGQWHKETLPRAAYCMDVDKVEYRIDPEGRVRVVGIYELIRWDWHHELDDIPERLAPYQGKVALLRRISSAVAEGQGTPFPTFFVWHRPDLSEFVVCRLEEWVDGPRRAIGLGSRSFAELIGGLPRWEGEPVSRS